MKRLRLFQLLGWWLLAALLAGLTGARTVRAQASPQLRCVFSAPSAQTGSTVDLRVELTNVNNLYGYQFELRFAPGTLQFTDGDPARAGINLALGTLISADFVAQNEVSAGNGEAVVAVTQLQPSQPRSGSGQLARAQVQPLTPGTLNVQLVNVILADNQAAAMPHDLEGCSLQVTGQALPTLTPGPTRTLAPTQVEDQTTSAPGQPTSTSAPTGTADPSGVTATATANLVGVAEGSAVPSGPTATLSFNTLAAESAQPEGTRVSIPLVSGGEGGEDAGAQDETSGGAGSAILRVGAGLAAVVILFLVLRRRALPH